MIELKRGYDLPKSKRETGRFPIISSSGFSDTHAEAKVDGPGVVTGRYGTIGTVYYVEEPYWPLNTTLYVRDFKDNDPRFVSYFLRGIDFLAYSDKAAVPGVNRNHLHLAQIRIPPLSEQRAIASVLSALDDKIELNRRMNATLEGLARALFRDWFVHFGPTRAKQEARRAAGTTGKVKMAGKAPYLAPEIWSLFPDRLDDDGVPEGWEIGTLGDIAETNARSWTAKHHPDQVEYVDLSNTKWGVIEATVNLSWKEAPSRARRIVQSGDTIVATTRPGNGSYAYISRDGLTASTGFVVLSPKKEMFRDYLYETSA